MAALTACHDAAAENWAQRLGFPPGKKVVVLHAHDMGMCFETTQACADLASTLPRLSASAMAPCPWFPHAAKHDSHSGLGDVGLQLTFNSEWSDYRWRPTSGAGLSPSLVDADGFLWRSVLQFALSADRDDVEREMHWQLLTAERCGLKPTHLTTHLGALYSRPDFAEAYLAFARKQWIPAVVVELTPELTERLAAKGFPVPQGLAAAISDYPLPTLKDLRIVPRAESYEEKLNATLEAVDSLPDGLSQIAFAPGVDSPALRALSPQADQYVWDLRLMQDESLKKRLQADDVILTNWVEIMERFDQ
ncbi:ChbG/HpnK family deacetylase [Posidoniimonas polymericola]|uniref:ChbG/HpnK family deacetylase n=1 Tax=Posidoniimonas polymericola TaxID=2528002 RepID=UPI0018D35808|nr:ChbG/HpnK family deacetylase [Posidoniimonas polymericola]